MERARARAERGVLRCWHAGESEAAARRMDQRVRSHGAGMRSVLSRPNGRPLRRSSGASDLGGGGIWHARLRRCCAVRLARTDSRSCACSSVWCRLVSDTQVPPASWGALRIGLVGAGSRWRRPTSSFPAALRPHFRFATRVAACRPGVPATHGVSVARAAGVSPQVGGFPGGWCRGFFSCYITPP